MYEQGLQSPEKVREIHNHHFDSTVWNDFVYRSDDIVIGSYAKSGTTWTQQLVGQILYRGDNSLPVADLSPWVDLRFPAKQEKLADLEAQTARRFMKTHLPVDALVFSEKAKYIYIARDGRDVVWSLYNHHSTANEKWYELLNETPGLVGPRMEPPVSDRLQYFREWLEFDGFPFWPYWENIRTWWGIRNLPNVLLIHFNDLLDDLEGQMHLIADFIGVRVSAKHRSTILRNCSFAWMKQHGGKCVPLNGEIWDGGAQSFIHRGTNGRWKGTLTQDDILNYERTAVLELGQDAASWLANGSGVAAQIDIESSMSV